MANFNSCIVQCKSASCTGRGQECSEALGIHFPTNLRQKSIGLMMFGHMSHYHVLQRPVIFSNLEGRPNMPFQFAGFPMFEIHPPGEVGRFQSTDLFGPGSITFTTP